MRGHATLLAACTVLAACAPSEVAPASREILVDPSQAPFPDDGALADGDLALTFDDGPAPTTTPRILEILAAHRVHAVFFQVGRNVEAAPHLTREIRDAGHSLASHSWDHPDLATLLPLEALDNIERGHAAVEAAAGSETSMFRFPMFSSTEQLRTTTHDRGLLTVHANIITEDWMTPDLDVLLEKSLAAVDAAGKGIVLFHDIQPVTAEMLDAFLTEIEARGYRTVVFRSR